jgi:hypothetical protein
MNHLISLGWIHATLNFLTFAWRLAALILDVYKTRYIGMPKPRPWRLSAQRSFLDLFFFSRASAMAGTRSSPFPSHCSTHSVNHCLLCSVR